MIDKDKILAFQSEINILIDKYMVSPTETETKLLSKIVSFYEKNKSINILIKNDDEIDSDNENNNDTINTDKYDDNDILYENSVLNNKKFKLFLFYSCFGYGYH